MEQYIKKSALIAEIEKLVDKGKYNSNYNRAFRDGNNDALYVLKKRIETLEVKEVDLEAEFQKKNRTMSKAEKFIQENTRNCSNLVYKDTINGKEFNTYNEWLTPDQARRAVEIAREEMIEKACDAYCKVCGHYAHTTQVYICRQACDYYKDFKQAMKDG